MEAETASAAPVAAEAAGDAVTNAVAAENAAPLPSASTATDASNAAAAATEDAAMHDAQQPNGDAAPKGEAQESAPEPLPEGASEVVYVHNLNEKIKLDVMKQSLKVLFREYGRVLGVTAHANVRMRGQAFVTLDSKDAAAKAVHEVQKFPLYGKPMVGHTPSFPMRLRH